MPVTTPPPVPSVAPDTVDTAPWPDAIALLPLVDVAKELERINKELDKARKNLASLEGKLSNESFVSRAPEKVVNDQREKLAKAKALLEQLEESEKRLKK